MYLNFLCVKRYIYIYINYFLAILPPPPVNRGPHARSAPSKTKVFSILDRARAAMDQSYK